MQTRRLATFLRSPSSMHHPSPSPQPRSRQKGQQTQPKQRQHARHLRESSLSPAAPTPPLSRDTSSRVHRDSGHNLKAPNKADFATQRITLAKEVGQSLRDALSDLHSSFSSVLSATTPKSAPAGALWPTGDPLLNLKSTTRVTHPEKKSSQQRWDDLLNHHVFNEPDEYNYVGTNYPDR